MYIRSYLINSLWHRYLTNSVSRNLGLDVTFIDGDFFAEDASWNVQGFDLVFDHT